MWNKEANWTQCSVIDVNVLRDYNPGLVRNLSDDTEYLCVASYDEDIDNDNMMLEPVVEFVGAKFVGGITPAYTHAKHQSLLHLECVFEGFPAVLELKASPKLAISKHNLIPVIRPTPKFVFEESAKTTFQTWLSSRYRRHRLPQSFIARTLPLWNYLKQWEKNYAEHVAGYWLSYAPSGREVQPSVPYVFSLYIVYSGRHSGAREHAERLASEVSARFPQWKDEYKEPGEIEMVECKACSDSGFTLADLQNCISFNLAHINYYGNDSPDAASESREHGESNPE